MITITHVVSSFDLGIYYAVSAYPQLLSRAFDMGLPHASRYFMLKIPNQRVRIIKLVSSLLGMITFAVLGSFFLLTQFEIESNDLIDKLSDNYLVLCFYCLGLIVNSILNAILLSFERLKGILIASTVPYVVFICIISYKYYYGVLEINDLFLQLLVSELIMTLIFLVSLRKLLLVSSPDEAETIGVGDLMRYASKTYAGGLLKTITTRLDRVVLSFIASPVFIGYYSVLMTLRDICIVPATSYGQVFSNRLSAVMKNSESNLERAVGSKLVILTAVYSLGLVIFLVIQRPILGIFFEVVTDEIVFASRFIMLSTIPVALISFLLFVFLIMNKPEHFSISSVIMIITCYSMIYWLYPRMDGNAFLVASVASPFVGLIYSLFYFRRLTKANRI